MPATKAASLIALYKDSFATFFDSLMPVTVKENLQLRAATLKQFMQ
jgi:hypothetical protein